MAAHLVAVGGDPTGDLERLRDVRLVVRDGRPVTDPLTTSGGT
jgi:hypothetical protein